jgi:hypothetical protein
MKRKPIMHSTSPIIAELYYLHLRIRRWLVIDDWWKLPSYLDKHYHTFRAALSFIKYKRWRWNSLEIIKAYGKKTRKFVIAPKTSLYWHEDHSMINSFKIDIIRVIG